MRLLSHVCSSFKEAKAKGSFGLFAAAEPAGGAGGGEGDELQRAVRTRQDEGARARQGQQTQAEGATGWKLDQVNNIIV